ncbi:hypothetical protein Bbelb_095410 [Branchiostoma belcheri]|nr:hypothetical protein Bbelb_095410 [Branchiostoma belcheri]
MFSLGRMAVRGFLGTVPPAQAFANFSTFTVNPVWKKAAVNLAIYTTSGALCVEGLHLYQLLKEQREKPEKKEPTEPKEEPTRKVPNYWTGFAADYVSGY